MSLICVGVTNPQVRGWKHRAVALVGNAWPFTMATLGNIPDLSLVHMRNVALGAVYRPCQNG